MALILRRGLRLHDTETQLATTVQRSHIEPQPTLHLGSRSLYPCSSPICGGIPFPVLPGGRTLCAFFWHKKALTRLSFFSWGWEILVAISLTLGFINDVVVDHAVLDGP